MTAPDTAVLDVASPATKKKRKYKYRKSFKVSTLLRAAHVPMRAVPTQMAAATMLVALLAVCLYLPVDATLDGRPKTTLATVDDDDALDQYTKIALTDAPGHDLGVVPGGNATITCGSASVDFATFQAKGYDSSSTIAAALPSNDTIIGWAKELLSMS